VPVRLVIVNSPNHSFNNNKKENVMAEMTVTRPETSKPLATSPRSFLPFSFGGELLTNAFPVLRQFAEELDRSFIKHIWAPALEVTEKEGVFNAKLELPGIAKEDLKVEVTEDALIVTGERKLQKEEKGENFFRSERYYGKFHREIALPKDAKIGDVKAELTNGVLSISVPVPETKDKVRIIPVTEGSTQSAHP
jgi:HSP20 family protein